MGVGYVSDVLQDARLYSEHANREKIDLSDVTLAVQSRVNHSFTQPPPREVSMITGVIIRLNES